MARAEHNELRGAARIAVVAAMTVVAAFVASKAARDAILLSNYSIEQLPLFVGITAALSLPIVVAAGYLFARVGPQRLLPWLNVVSAVLLAGEWVLLQDNPRVATVLVYLHLGSLGAVLVSGFWSIVNERFDVQSAKRYAGRIGAGATLGGIVGGVVAERTAVYGEPGSILLVLGVLQLVCAVALRTLAQGGRQRRVSGEEIARLSALRTISRISLLRNLALLVVLGAIGAAALDFVFKAEVIAATDGHPLRTFAIYHSATSMLTAVVQIAVARLALSRLGIARTVMTLPFTVTGLGLLGLFVPGLTTAVIARGGEAVARSSVYRVGYELLFAPLPEHDKRSTKVMLDVGAERIGDLFGAQLVGFLVYTTVTPRVPVMIAAVAVGVLASMVAMRIPGAYRRALERSLLERGKHGTPPPDDDDPASSLAWSALRTPTMSEVGAEGSMLSLLDLRADKVREIVPGEPRPRPSVPAVLLAPGSSGLHKRPNTGTMTLGDPILDKIASLRVRDVARVRLVLAGGITSELLPHVIPLLAWNDVAREAHTALSLVAANCTGALVDVLLDAEQEFTIRRRLPAVLVAGDPELAAWGLWRGLADTRFEVRYRCGRALGELRNKGYELPFGEPDLHELIDKELSVAAEVMHNYRLIDGDDEKPELALPPSTGASPTALAHIFNLLGLALPAEPIRIAFHGLHTDDRDLRATALEYLESALPQALNTRLWPLIERESAPRRQVRTREELMAALQLSAPKIEARLAALRESSIR